MGGSRGWRGRTAFTLAAGDVGGVFAFGGLVGGLLGGGVVGHCGRLVVVVLWFVGILVWKEDRGLPYCTWEMWYRT